MVCDSVLPRVADPGEIDPYLDPTVKKKKTRSGSDPRKITRMRPTFVLINPDWNRPRFVLINPDWIRSVLKCGSGSDLSRKPDLDPTKPPASATLILIIRQFFSSNKCLYVVFTSHINSCFSICRTSCMIFCWVWSIRNVF